MVQVGEVSLGSDLYPVGELHASSSTLTTCTIFAADPKTIECAGSVRCRV